LIHICGAKGVGKTELATYIVAAYEAKGKTAVSLADLGLQEGYSFFHVKKISELRHTPLRVPGTRKAKLYDYLIVEHPCSPDLGDVAPNEWVITVERGQ